MKQFGRDTTIKRVLYAVVLIVLTCTGLAARTNKTTTSSQQPKQKIVRCAVIGGMTMTGLWQQIAKRFEAKTGYKLEVVATGPRPGLDTAFRAGKADLLTMHSGDITTDLVADGYGINMRPWTRNDLVIVGPESDPAHIAGLKDGAEALRRIAETRSNFVDLNSKGSRELAHTLWARAGLKPQGDWLLQDGCQGDHQQLRFAESHNAYIIIGRMPVINGKLANAGQMKILVDQDPTMRRPYIVMEANPEKISGVNIAGARALSDFLLSNETQRFLLTYTTKIYTTQQQGVPLFYPVKDVARKPQH